MPWTRTVPAALPSVFQSSAPLALKNMVEPTGAKFCGLEDAAAGTVLVSFTNCAGWPNRRARLRRQPLISPGTSD